MLLKWDQDHEENQRIEMRIYQPQGHFHKIMVPPWIIILCLQTLHLSVLAIQLKIWTQLLTLQSWWIQVSVFLQISSQKYNVFVPPIRFLNPLSSFFRRVVPLTSLNGALWLIPPVRLDDAQQGQQQGGLPSTGATYNTWPFRRRFHFDSSIPFSTLFCVHDLFKTIRNHYKIIISKGFFMPRGPGVRQRWCWKLRLSEPMVSLLCILSTFFWRCQELGCWNDSWDSWKSSHLQRWQGQKCFDSMIVALVSFKSEVGIFCQETHLQVLNLLQNDIEFWEVQVLQEKKYWNNWRFGLIGTLRCVRLWAKAAFCSYEGQVWVVPEGYRFSSSDVSHLETLNITNRWLSALTAWKSLYFSTFKQHGHLELKLEFPLWQKVEIGMG